MLELVPTSANQDSEFRFSNDLESPLDLAHHLQLLDPASWQRLYVDYRRLVRSVVAAHLGYGPDVDDVVQAVFETALDLVSRSKVRLTGSASGMRAWLLAIALRLAQSELRRRKRARVTNPARDCDEFGAPPLDAEGRQLLGRTLALLGQLPDRLRAPWILRHFERMSLEETAECLRVSLATAKRRLAAADRRFMTLAHHDAVLRERLMGGGLP